MSGQRQPNEPLPIRATLLGEVRISVGDRLIGDDAWSLRSARSLFLLLLITRGHSMPKERVLDILWPESNLQVARNALYKALHLLRRVLEPDLTRAPKSAYIETRSGRIAIASDVEVWVDADAYETALRQAGHANPDEQRNRLRQAVDMYRGELLPTDPYEDWPVARREALRSSWEGAVLDLAARDLEAKDPQASVASLEFLLASDPTNEAAHRALMRGYFASGQPDRAMRQYARCESTLENEFGVEPDAETQALYTAIKNAIPDTDLQQDVADGPFNNLPTPPTEIVGRDREIESLTGTLWRQDVRLMTLTGPGGVGKTRLALEVADRLVDDFADGIAFVQLAAVRDNRLVLQSITSALGLSESPGISMAGVLQSYLRNREMLLVLDNFEQIMDAATDIGNLLMNCASVTVLVTSRERLQLRGEHVHEVPPLTVPRTDRLPSPAVLARYGSVVLFQQHMQRIDPDFHVTPENSEVVGAICSHLEGLPLAIELATARARFYSLDTLLSRLTSRLDIEEGQRDLPARQRTLRSTVAWSHDLLSAEEQVVFRRLGTAVGGYTIEAAEAVCGDASSGMHRHLYSLAEKHLIRWEKGDEGPRIGMLETIREFAMELLRESGEEEHIKRRHADYFLGLTIQAEEHLVGDEQLMWFERLENELGNIRSSLDWALDQQDDSGTLGAKGAVALWRFWWRRGLASEGIAWLDRTESRRDMEHELRVSVLLSLAHLREVQSDYPGAEVLINEALHLSQASGDQAGVAKALNGLGEIAEDHGDLERAAAVHRQALEIYQENGLLRDSARSLNNIATVAYFQGDFEAASAQWSEAVAIIRELGDHWSTSVLLGNLGSAAMALGNFDRAVALHEENLAIARHLKDPGAIGRGLCNLAEAMQIRGDGDQDTLLEEALVLNRDTQDKQGEFFALSLLAASALERGSILLSAQLYSESLLICASLGDRATMANIAILERIAELAFLSAQPARAIQLLGASETLRDEVGAPIMPYLRPVRDRCLALAEKYIDVETMGANITEGRSWSTDVAIQVARTICEFARIAANHADHSNVDVSSVSVLRGSQQ